MDWKLVLALFTIAASAISGIIAFVVKAIINNLLNKDIETYKAKLQSTLTEHQIRFAKLHEERAMVMKELYRRLVKMHKSLYTFMHPFQREGDLPMNEKQKNAGYAVWDFVTYYDDNKLYFSQTICNLIEDIYDYVKKSWREFTMFPSYEKFFDHELENRRIQKWDIAWDKISVIVPKLMNQLENEFRKLLGVEAGK